MEHTCEVDGKVLTADAVMVPVIGKNDSYLYVCDDTCADKVVNETA